MSIWLWRYDASSGGEPLKATIFDAMEVLLGVNLGTLVNMDEHLQEYHVYSCMVKMKLCDNTIKRF